MLEQGDDKQENFRNAVGVHCRFRCLLTALAQRYRKIGETRRPDIFFGLWVTTKASARCLALGSACRAYDPSSCPIQRHRPDFPQNGHRASGWHG